MLSAIIYALVDAINYVCMPTRSYIIHKDTLPLLVSLNKANTSEVIEVWQLHLASWCIISIHSMAWLLCAKQSRNLRRDKVRKLIMWENVSHNFVLNNIQKRQRQQQHKAKSKVAVIRTFMRMRICACLLVRLNNSTCVHFTVDLINVIQLHSSTHHRWEEYHCRLNATKSWSMTT